MTNLTNLLSLAKAGQLNRSALAEVAGRIERATAREQYTCIHILGLMNAVEYESLVASQLDQYDSPMVARIALQVLCSHWGKASIYRNHILQFANGVAWDTDDEVRLAAVSAAGELARSTGDLDLLDVLLQVFDCDSNSRVLRDSAYFAIARAAGKAWSELPPAHRHIDHAKEIDADVLTWARSAVLGKGST